MSTDDAPSHTDPGPGPATAGIPRPGEVIRFDPEASVAALLGNASRSPIASPGARRTATERGVDLDAVVGTGRQGRITQHDIDAHSASAPVPSATGTTAPSAPKQRSGETSSMSEAPTSDGLPPGYAGEPHTSVRLSSKRRAIAEHMVRSRATSAHASVEVEFDLGMLDGVRQEVNADLAARNGKPLSYLPFVARAVVVALREYPDLNASLVGDRLLTWHRVHLGIAVDTEEGLLVPVLRDADELTAQAIAQRINDLASQVRERAARVTDLRGGTFTISNVGSVGPVTGSPIINQPQVAILVLGAAVRRPWVCRSQDGSETIGIRPIMQATLTFDHRVVDGARAGRFLEQIRHNVQTWSVAAYR